MFNHFFIANLLLSVTVKEFGRSVRIWQSYGKKYSDTFFTGHGVATTAVVAIVVVVIIVVVVVVCSSFSSNHMHESLL